MRQDGRGAGAGNLDLVRRAFDAFGRRDLDTLVALTDPEVELFTPISALSAIDRCYRGHAGIARYLGDLERRWERFELIPRKLREVGHHVVVLGTVRAGDLRGIDVESSAAWVWQVRAGLLSWGCLYADGRGASLEQAEAGRSLGIMAGIAGLPATGGATAL